MLPCKSFQLVALSACVTRTLALWYEREPCGFSWQRHCHIHSAQWLRFVSDSLKNTLDSRVLRDFWLKPSQEKEDSSEEIG
jgi:hypothetical protein